MKHTAQDFNTGFHNAEIMMENQARQGAQTIQGAADNAKQQFQVLYLMAIRFCTLKIIFVVVAECLTVQT